MRYYLQIIVISLHIISNILYICGVFISTEVQFSKQVPIAPYAAKSGQSDPPIPDQ